MDVVYNFYFISAGGRGKYEFITYMADGTGALKAGMSSAGFHLLQ